MMKRHGMLSSNIRHLPILWHVPLHAISEAKRKKGKGIQHQGIVLSVLRSFFPGKSTGKDEMEEDGGGAVALFCAGQGRGGTGAVCRY